MNWNTFAVIYLSLIPVIMSVGCFILGYVKTKRPELAVSRDVAILFVFSILWPFASILTIVFIPFRLLFLIGGKVAK
jgi:hypothetical protein